MDVDKIQLEQADGRTHTASTHDHGPASSTRTLLPTPTVFRRTKSITDFHKRVQRRSQEQDDTKAEANCLADLSISSDLDFARSYDEASDALADATHQRYQ